MSFLSVFFLHIRMHFKARMEYRSDFFLGILSNLYSYFVTFLTFWVILERFGTIDGWVFEEMCILYALNISTYAMAGMFYWTASGLEFELISGKFDGFLVRPMGILRQLATHKIVDTFVGQVVVSLAFLIYAFTRVQVDMNFMKIVFLIFTFVSSFLIHAGAMVFFGALSFWIKRSLPIMNMLYWNLRLFTQYPLSIFPLFIQMLLTFILPWGFISYYPTLFILDKQRNMMETVMGAISPVVGIAVYSLAMFVFYRGLRRYDSTGS